MWSPVVASAPRRSTPSDVAGGHKARPYRDRLDPLNASWGRAQGSPLHRAVRCAGAPERGGLITGGRAQSCTLTPTKTDTWGVADSHRMPEVDTVVLLGYRRGTSVEEADSRTLLTLMLLKRRLQSLDRPELRVVTELLDVENVDLALLTGADDYVVSDAITSRLMTQLADQPKRRAVVRELYGPTGPSIHLVGAGELGLGGECEWNEIVTAAYLSGLLAIGWRLASPTGSDPVLNPDGSDRVVLTDDDHVVVIG